MLATLLLTMGVTGTTQAAELKVGGTGAVLAAVQRAAEAFHQQQQLHHVVVLPNMGSTGAIKAVLTGALQLGLSGRPLTPAELAAGAQSSPLGRTPLVFAVATHHPAEGTSRPQLSNIYSGRLTNWPDGGHIRPVLRPANDSDTLLLQSALPALAETMALAAQRPGQTIALTDQEAATQLENTPGAIGPTTLVLIQAEKRALKALALDGVPADLRQMAEGRYTLTKTLLLVTGPVKSPAADAFIAFLRSPGGRQLMAQLGLQVH